MDGRIKALKELINQAGFSGMESLSFPDIGGDYTLAEARNDFPDMVIIPNFPSNLCSRKDEEIVDFLVNLKAEAGDETPFMLQVSEDLDDSQWMRVLPILTRIM